MVKVKGEMLLMVITASRSKGRDVAHGNNGVLKVKERCCSW